MPTTLSLKPSPTLVVERCLRELAAQVLRALAAWQRQRDERAALDMLNGLDARSLRDLGLDRSELSSAAAELFGHAVPQRRHVLHSLAVTEQRR